MERYTKTGFLGSGAYSSVYSGVDNLTGKQVALKVCKLSPSEGFPATSLREISLLKRLNHPNIILLLDVVYEKSLVLVFEKMDTDLKSFLLKQTVDIVPLVRQLFLGLNYLHSNSVVHRDLKPQNILISNDGTLKIADLGLARSTDIAKMRCASEVVTLWYRAPELLRGCVSYSSAVDLWSIGCILPEMVSGEVLLQGADGPDQLNIIEKALKSGMHGYVRVKTGELPKYLEDIIFGCLLEDMNKRFTTSKCLELMGVTKSPTNNE